MVFTILCSMLVVSLVFVLVSILFTETEKGSLSSDVAFECGFEPFFLPRVPFSIHYFTVTVVFLIFDLEIVILLPILTSCLSYSFSLQLLMVILALFLGLVIEWYDHSLEWQK